MTNTFLPPVSDPGFSFKSVTFRSLAPVEAAVLLAFSAQEKGVALLNESPPDVWPDARIEKTRNTLTAPDFDCVFLNSSTANPELIKRAKIWINPDESAAVVASIRIKIMGGWVLARPGRVVVCAPVKNWNDIAKALADFYFHEWELRKLEREVDSDWLRAEADLPLANNVTPNDLTRLNEIGVTTQGIWMRRIRLARLERPLAKCAAPLPLHARKLAARLRVEYDVAERVEILDGQIEVYEYIYEMANQRMGEYGNFRKEFLLEILIVVLLAAELCVMVLEFLRNTHRH